MAKKETKKVAETPKEKTSNKKVDKKKKTIKEVVKNIKNAANSKKNDTKPKAFEDKPNLSKLVLVVVVVDLGISKSVEKLLQNLGSSMQFTHNGRGTASKEILNVLGVVDNSKGVVNAVINEDRWDDVKKELSIFFAASKKNRGIAFTIPFSSVVGVRIYKYLSQTM